MVVGVLAWWGGSGAGGPPGNRRDVPTSASSCAQLLGLSGRGCGPCVEARGDPADPGKEGGGVLALLCWGFKQAGERPTFWGAYLLSVPMSMGRCSKTYS